MRCSLINHPFWGYPHSRKPSFPRFVEPLEGSPSLRTASWQPPSHHRTAAAHFVTQRLTASVLQCGLAGRRASCPWVRGDGGHPTWKMMGKWWMIRDGKWKLRNPSRDGNEIAILARPFLGRVTSRFDTAPIKHISKNGGVLQQDHILSGENGTMNYCAKCQYYSLGRGPSTR